MANFPMFNNRIPGGDPIIDMTIGTEEGRLLTDQWGSKFVIEGDIRLAALAVLKHVTSPNDFYGSIRSAYDPVRGKITSMTFSRFDFDFENGVKITAVQGKESEEVSVMIKEMEKILKIKAFL